MTQLFRCGYPRDPDTIAVQETTTNRSQTILSSCPPSFENDLRRRVGQGPIRVHVRNLVMVLVPFPLTPRSKGTADYRCYEDVSRYRHGISRCFSSPQSLFGRYHCAHQTLRCTFLSSSAPTPLTDSLQQSKDVEDKLGDLIPWLAKLKDSAMLTSVDGNREEAERREQLKRYVQHLRRLVDPNQPPVDPWKTSRVDLKRC